MVRALIKRGVSAVAMLFAIAGCATSPPAVDAANSTVAPTTAAPAESTTTTTIEQETTTTGRRFFSTTTDPDAPTTTKSKSTTTKARATTTKPRSTTTKPKSTNTTSRSATTAPSSGGDYPAAVEAEFLDSCNDSSGGETSYCLCVWDEITTTITYERFQEIETAIKAGAEATSFPDVNAAIASCNAG